MLKMNAFEAQRDAINRQDVLRSLTANESFYNTGSALVVNDAYEYIGYCLAKQPLYPNAFAGPVQTESLSATGAVGCLMYEIKAEPTTSTHFTPIVTPSKMVEMVRNAFMLTVRDASAVFHVSRPTIYQWESLSDIEQIRAHKDRERLKHLYRVAMLWITQDPLFGRWLNETLPSGKSVLDLLKEERIDDAALKSAHNHLHAALPRLRRTEHTRSMAAARAMKGAFERLAANEKARAKG